jgi:hypothetical protein
MPFEQYPTLVHVLVPHKRKKAGDLPGMLLELSAGGDASDGFL